MKKYTTLIFDLDGTLLHTIPDITNSINKTLIEYGFSIQYINKDVEKFIGDGAVKLINRALKQFNVSNELEHKFYLDYCASYSNHRNDLTKPFDEVIPTLEILKNKGYILGVVSNKPHIDTINVIDRYFNNIFDIVMGKKDNVKPKPHKDVFDNIKSEYNLIEKDILYIGDMKVDIEFAKNINVDVAILTYGYGKITSNEGQTYTLNKFSDILKLTEETK